MASLRSVLLPFCGFVYFGWAKVTQQVFSEYDGRNLVTREVNALGDSTIYVYDGNGNMVSKTDADGYVTQYSYTALDLVQKINYNGAKEVSYQYNKVGEAEGDSGELTFQGTRYLNFRREGAE